MAAAAAPQSFAPTKPAFSFPSTAAPLCQPHFSNIVLYCWSQTSDTMVSCSGIHRSNEVNFCIKKWGEHKVTPALTQCFYKPGSDIYWYWTVKWLYNISFQKLFHVGPECFQRCRVLTKARLSFTVRNLYSSSSSSGTLRCCGTETVNNTLLQVSRRSSRVTGVRPETWGQRVKVQLSSPSS